MIDKLSKKRIDELKKETNFDEGENLLA